MANNENNQLPKIMTVKEVSEYLKVHPSTVYKLVKNGGMPAFRVGSDWRFASDVIDRWLDKLSINN
jgi:excisionase family DNA binding protein